MPNLLGLERIGGRNQACALLQVSPATLDNYRAGKTQPKALELMRLLGAQGHAISTYLTPWAEWLAADRLAEIQGAQKNWMACLGRIILTTPIEQWRHGTRQTVGELLDDFIRDRDGELTFERANRELAAAGLALRRSNARATDYRLFIPDNNPALQRLFWNTRWYGRPDAGGWADALRQGPPEWIIAGERARVSGWQHRGCDVPLRLICSELIDAAAARLRQGDDEII